VTFQELVNDIVIHMNLVEVADGGAAADPTSGTVASTDVKRSTAWVRSITKLAAAHIADVLRRAGDQSLLWALCKESKGLVVGTKGYYRLGDGNPYADATLDGDEIETTGTDTTDTKVDGNIVAVEITYSTPTAAPVASSTNPNPLSAASWQYAEPDSAAAIRRRRILATRLLAPLYSYEIVGRRVYTAGTGVRITFVPSDFGESSSGLTTVPNEIALPIMAEALSMLYGQSAAQSEIGAAAYYNSKAGEYKQMLASGVREFEPITPYKAS
jgi:hypothetical protein